MAAPRVVRALRALPPICPVPIGTRHLHSTPPCLKAQAGRVRVGKGDRPVSYEEAHGPHYIGHRKGWLSLHTGNLCAEAGAAERALEDTFVRRFVRGTFPGLLLAPQLLFLQGYAEALLSAFHRSPVRLELHTLPAPPAYKRL